MQRIALQRMTTLPQRLFSTRQKPADSTGTKILNFLHKATTFTLFSITLMGLYVVGDAGYNILQKHEKIRLETAAKAAEAAPKQEDAAPAVQAAPEQTKQ